MPVICDGCGTANRDRALFCSGCAARLHAVEPSGLSALEASEPPRSPPQREAEPSQPGAAGAAAGLLPAEKTEFWLQLVVLGTAMSVAFFAWYLYITREIPAPSPRTQVEAVPSSPEKTAAQGAPAPSAPAAPTLPPSPTAAPSPAPMSMPKPAPAADATPAPARAEAPARAAQDPARERADEQQRTASVEARSRVRTPGYAPLEQARDLPSAASQRPQGAARWNDPGPPIALGPGPRYDPGPPVAVGPGPRSDSARAPSRLADDPGPPVAPGPGPLYTSPRLPAATSPGVRADPGPPIAIGPGPLVDYSVRGGQPR